VSPRRRDLPLILWLLSVGLILELAQEVLIQPMHVIDIAALGLAHGDEVLDQQTTVVFADSPCLFQALVWVERELLLLQLQGLGLLLKHVSECCLFI